MAGHIHKHHLAEQVRADFKPQRKN